MNQKRQAKCARGFALGLLGTSMFAGLTTIGAYAQEAGESSVRKLQTITVTARKKEESLQDVPVAVTAVPAESIEAYGLDKLSTIAERVPNLKIQTGGAGAGGGIFFRGIGANSNGGAFESSLAVAVDGGIVNTARIVQNSFFDLESFEVLKGPQALYFGKAATAGALSLRTKNPSDEFEASGAVSYEIERETWIGEGIVSGPITDNLGARLAVRYKDTAVVNENLSPGVVNPERGEQSFDVRGTLEWDPTDDLNINLKYTNMNYEGDGTFQNTRIVQFDTLVPGLDKGPRFQLVSPGQTALPDALIVANSNGARYLRDGVPYTENTTQLLNLTASYDISDDYRVSGIYSWIGIEDEGLENYSQATDASGTSGSLNEFDIHTIEARIEGDVTDDFSFMAGAFFEDSNQFFDADQFLGFGAIGAAYPVTGLGGPIVATTPGFENAVHDVSKTHDTDSEITAFFASFDWDVTDQLTFSGGVRHTDVSREGTISVLYVHDYINAVSTDVASAQLLAATLGGLGPANFGLIPVPVAQGTGALFAGAADTANNGTFTTPVIQYADDDMDIELTANYEFLPDQNVYIAYKEAYKPGGIDNAATAWNSDITSVTSAGEGLVFGSEVVDGFEIGYKGQLLDNSLRLNGVFYNYDYSDFQVQTFNSQALSFVINNAGAVKSRGVEVDFEYLPDVDGLSFYGSVAIDDSSFEEFIVPIVNHDLAGRRPASLAPYAGTLGFTYENEMSGGWGYNFGYNLNVSGDYFVHNQLSGVCADAFPGCAKEGLAAPKQEAYATHDLTFRLTSPDSRWNASIIANNVFDEYFVITSGGVVPQATDDHSFLYNNGRTVTFRVGAEF